MAMVVCLGWHIPQKLDWLQRGRSRSIALLYCCLFVGLQGALRLHKYVYHVTAVDNVLHTCRVSKLWLYTATDASHWDIAGSYKQNRNSLQKQSNRCSGFRPAGICCHGHIGYGQPTETMAGPSQLGAEKPQLQAAVRAQAGI